MTEYNYSPTEYANYLSKQASVAKWTEKTGAIEGTPLNPFFPEGAQPRSHSKALVKSARSAGCTSLAGNYGRGNGNAANFNLPDPISTFPTIQITSGAHTLVYTQPTKVQTTHTYTGYPSVVPANQVIMPLPPMPVPLHGVGGIAAGGAVNMGTSTLNAISSLTTCPVGQRIRTPSNGKSLRSLKAKAALHNPNTTTHISTYKPFNSSRSTTSSPQLTAPDYTHSQGRDSDALYRVRDRKQSARTRPADIVIPPSSGNFSSSSTTLASRRRPQTPYHSTTTVNQGDPPAEIPTRNPYARWEDSGYNPAKYHKVASLQAKSNGYEDGSVANLKKYASRSTPSLDQLHRGELMTPVPPVPALPSLTSTVKGYQPIPSAYTHASSHRSHHRSRTPSTARAHPTPNPSRAPSRADSRAPSESTRSRTSTLASCSSVATLPLPQSRAGTHVSSSHSHRYPSPYGQTPSRAPSHASGQTAPSAYPYPLHDGRGDPEEFTGSGFAFDNGAVGSVDNRMGADEMGYAVEQGYAAQGGEEDKKKKGSFFGRLLGRDKGKEEKEGKMLKKRERRGSF